MKTNENKTLDTFAKILVAILLIGGIVVFTWIFNGLFIKKYTVENFYVIKRTTTFPPKLVSISKNYKLYDFKYFNQYVPIKTYSTVGNEFFFTVEMVDSTFIKDYTNYFLGIFHYEGLRFCVGCALKNYLNPTDPKWKLTGFLKDNYTVIHNNKNSIYPDTLYYKGLKVYNIEKYTLEKYIEKRDSLTETDSLEDKVGYFYGLPEQK